MKASRCSGVISGQTDWPFDLLERVGLDHVEPGAVHHDQRAVAVQQLHAFRFAVDDRLEELPAFAQLLLRLVPVGYVVDHGHDRPRAAIGTVGDR